ncbi:unnamed protein product [Penicillium salamii]|uniref:Uncharacterized protein n=1 Tax=Penicillium salamii TaxID=1612424 RepID=A0A9W4J9S8_9EURO|nr:unnamed protein product [Penicillium salamii]CAG7987082.1 unnamed protein product [Penicillium salamii]CAG8168619.1 unnamed protein product [Penicillium salamii]CAG8232381.1 unnamed protein product [Penicillium salamii]CAG8245758.1 unnamed protein product [Penicillium salamii]
MKSVVFSALLASAVALPTNVLSGLTGSLPAGLPACLPSGIIPSDLPLPIASLIPTCSGVPSASSSSAMANPTSAVTSMTKSAGAGQVLSVLNQAGTSNVKMMAESELQGLMSKLPLSTLEQPIGQVIQTAQSVDQLDSSNGSGVTQVTALLENGNAALIELTQDVVDLLSSLGLGQVGSLLGSIVGGLESVTGYIKRDEPLSSALGSVKTLTSNIKREDPLAGLFSVTDLDNVAGGQNMLFQLEPTLLGLLGGLEPSSIQGPVGNLVASAPSLSGLQSQMPNIPGASFIVVQAQDQASVLLIQVDSALQGLLSSLGLGSVGTVVGTVVNTVQGSISQ